MGILLAMSGWPSLSSVQIQDERVAGSEGPFTLLSQKKGSRVSICNVSLWFEDQKEITQILCQPPASREDFGF